MAAISTRWSMWWRFERRGFPLASAVTAALATGALYFASAAAVQQAVEASRLLAFIPVVLASYRPYRHLPGLLYALFLGSLIVWQAAWGVLTGQPGADFPGALLTFGELLVAVLLASGLASIFGGRDELVHHADELQALLERGSNLQRVASFFRTEAQRDSRADESALLIRNDIEGRWEFVTQDDVQALPAIRPLEPPKPAGAVPLGLWLRERERAELIEDISIDRRFETTGGARSLLAHPLFAPDGSLLATLVLVHSDACRFTAEDLAQVQRLSAAAETALRQAGDYAEIAQRKERIAGQLAEIQRTGRELNASLEPHEIARLTAVSARRLVAADAAGVAAELEGGVATATAAERPLAPDAPRVFDRAMRLTKAAHETPESGGEGLLPGSRSRLLVPVIKGRRTLAAIVVESQRAGAFTGQDLHALGALADHAAIALENAQLFAVVRAERERTEEIIRSMGDGLIRATGDGRVLDMNPAAEKMVGHSAPDTQGKSVCEVLGCAAGPGCHDGCELLSALAAGRPFFERRWRMQDPSGPAEHVLAIRATPLAVPAEQHEAIILIQDVTEDERLERFQRELLATFSHELRGPLANLRAIAEVALADASAAPGALSRNMLEMLEAQTQRLDTLAQRTLDVSRLDAGAWQLEPRPVAISGVARDAARRWQGAHPRMQFALRAPEEALWALGDEDAVGIILDNLLQNAVKYGLADSAVTIALETESRGMVTVGVEDCGDPIPESEREAIFERFYRREKTEARKTYGFGLGLYIVRQLARMMGGDAWAEPAAGTGNRFVFTLPRLERDEPNSDQ